MPKTILGRKKMPHEGLVKLIWGELGSKGLSAADMAPMMGVSPNTARRRLRCPGEFTVDELLSLAKNLDIPLDRLRAVITYG